MTKEKETKTEIKEDRSKYFEQLDNPDWISETELFEKQYELQTYYDNCKKMRKVRANRKR
jgi:hypothetical protein